MFHAKKLGISSLLGKHDDQTVINFKLCSLVYHLMNAYHNGRCIVQYLFMFLVYCIENEIK